MRINVLSVFDGLLDRLAGFARQAKDERAVNLDIELAAIFAEIGGFEAFKDCLADDYWLAERARALGLRTVLSSVVVATDVIEPTFIERYNR